MGVGTEQHFMSSHREEKAKEEVLTLARGSQHHNATIRDNKKGFNDLKTSN